MEGLNQNLKVKWLPVERKKEHGGENKHGSYTSLNILCLVGLILELQKYFT